MRSCHHTIHHLTSHLRLILREHTIFPATKESYRIKVGTSNQNFQQCLFNLVKMPRLVSPNLMELLQGCMGSHQKGLTNLGILNEWLAVVFVSDDYQNSEL
jgi:hypothetical protein